MKIFVLLYLVCLPFCTSSLETGQTPALAALLDQRSSVKSDVDEIWALPMLCMRFFTELDQHKNFRDNKNRFSVRYVSTHRNLC